MKCCRMVSTGASTTKLADWRRTGAATCGLYPRRDPAPRRSRRWLPTGRGQHDPHPEPDGIGPAHRPCARC
jgi:hypothetical protein